MITFQPVKTRTFRGLNANERFGQSIVNKYQFSSKPYLGLLNLLYLDLANENSDSNHSNLYNFMVQLRLQLDKQQHNKEYNLFASRPFLYQMLEKILINQSSYGSGLKTYRNYITQLNVNESIRKPADLQIPLKKIQFSRNVIRSNNDLNTVTKAIASITVKPRTSVEQLGKTSMVDRQMTYHYRKPLIESIWMNRIASITSDRKLTPLVNQLNRMNENNQSIDSINVVERIVLNHRILKQLYAFGRQQDVLKSGTSPKLFEQLNSDFLLQEEFEEIHTTLRRDVVKGTARIEASLLLDQKGTVVNRVMLDQHNLAFIRNYRKQLNQVIWNNQISLNTQKLMRSSRAGHSNSNQVHFLPADHKMKQRHEATSSFLDYKTIVERMYDTQQILTFLNSRGIITDPVSENVQERISSINLDIIKSRVNIVTESSDRVDASDRLISSTEEVQNVIRSYRKDLTQTIWAMKSLKVSASLGLATVFDVAWISHKISHANEVIRSQQYSNGHETTSTHVTNRDTDLLTVVKSLVLGPMNTSPSNDQSLKVNTVTARTINDENYHQVLKSYRRQLIESIWLHKNSNNSVEQRGMYATQLARNNERMLPKLNQFPISDIFNPNLVEETLVSRHDAFQYLRENNTVQDANIQINKPFQLTLLTETTQTPEVITEVIRSLTTVVNRTLNRNNESTSSIIRFTDTKRISSQYHRQLVDSIWSSQLLEKQQSSLGNKTSNSTSSIFDQKFIEERLYANRNAIQYLVDHGIQIRKSVELSHSPSSILSSLNMSEVVKSLTSVVNRNSNVNRTLTVTPEEFTLPSNDKLVVISSSKMLKQQYHQRLADSISIVPLSSKPYSPELIEQTSTINIFDKQFIEERLHANHRIVSFMIESGIKINKPVELSYSIESEVSPLVIMDVIKSITSVVNKTSKESTNDTTNDTLSSTNDSLIVISNAMLIKKQYHRQLSDSIWIAPNNSKQRISEIIEQTTTTNIFDHQFVEERLLANRRAVTFMIASGIKMDKPVELSYSIESEVAPQVITDVIKSVTSVVNRTSNLDRITNEKTNKTLSSMNDTLIVISNAMLIKKQYHRQLSDSIWIAPINSKQRISEIIEETTTTNIFNQQFIEERLHANRRAIALMIESGIKVNKPVDLSYSSDSAVGPAEITEVIKSITYIVNRNSNESTATRDNELILITNAKTIKKQYHRQLAESIWITQRIDKHKSSMMLEESTTTNIFDQQFIEERLQANRNVVAYMIESGISINQPLALIGPSQTVNEQESVIDIVKSLTRIIETNNDQAALTTMNATMIENLKQVSKQYKRQLADSIWITRATDSRRGAVTQTPTAEQQQLDKITTILKNHRMLYQFKPTVSHSIFDYLIIDEKLSSNRKAIEYMLDYGVDMKKPLSLVTPTLITDHSTQILDVVKSLTRMVNSSAKESTITPNETIISNRTIISNVSNETVTISKLLKRRLSDTVWISRILEVTKSQSSEQQSNYSTRISRRNKRILNKTIMNVSAEIFDQKVIEERLHVNQKALKYMLDYGVPLNKPIQLITPNRDSESEHLQDVVRAITKIEFGNSTTKKSISKLFIQQYKRQLTETIWMKQIHENSSTISKKSPVLVQADKDTFITDNYLEKIDRVNNRITQLNVATNVTDMFNNRIVEQRLQHNKIAVEHLQKLGVTLHSPIHMLLPNQMQDLTVPVNDVVKAITQIVAKMPSLNREKINKVIPIELLRQYRKQLTDSIVTDQLELAELRSQLSKRHATRIKATNPIIQVLQRKVSGSVFDSIVMDERIHRDIEAMTRQDSHLSNHTIEQRSEHLVSWLLPKSPTSELLPNSTRMNEMINRSSNRSILRRLQLIRSNHHQLDSNTMETVRAYTSTLFTSTEIDYLNSMIAGNLTTKVRNSIRKQTNPSANLMNTKISWLQGVVEHLVKSSTVSNIGFENLTTEKRKSINKRIQSNLQHLFIVPDSTEPERRTANRQTVQPISFVHSSPTASLDVLNDELMHRIDKEASLDYLKPKPVVTQQEKVVEPTIKPVEFDAPVEQDKVKANPLNHIDMNELVDKIYSEIERKMAFERQRRGF